ANLKPNDTALAEYDNNSINTNNGTNGNGVPTGTNKLKNTTLCKYNPNIVKPIHKLNEIEIINTILVAIAKLYGIIPIKLATKINTNNNIDNTTNPVYKLNVVKFTALKSNIGDDKDTKVLILNCSN
ncbi:hypothetical protein C6P40_005004, partial [Pichia californica]